MFELVDTVSQQAVIKVIGVGGGGGNAVEHMLTADLDGVDFINANTDAQMLARSAAPTCSSTSGRTRSRRTISAAS